jgi:hypothetical protein
MDAITPQLRAAILDALSHHECGSREETAYSLSFARIGQSGASFGPLQADCHADPAALTAIEQILRAAKVPTAQLGRMLWQLREAMPHGWPGMPGDLVTINTAIGSTQGRAIVDQLMQTILDGLCVQLDRCVAAAAENGSIISPDALIGMAIWINQDGPPTVLIDWLRGAAVTLGGAEVPDANAGGVVDLPNWLEYYEHIPFVQQHANQKPALLDAIQIGVKALGAAS